MLPPLPSPHAHGCSQSGKNEIAKRSLSRITGQPSFAACPASDEECTSCQRAGHMRVHPIPMGSFRANDQKHDSQRCPQADEHPTCFFLESLRGKNPGELWDQQNTGKNSKAAMQQNQPDVNQAGGRKNVQIGSRKKQNNQKNPELTPGNMRML